MDKNSASALNDSNSDLLRPVFKSYVLSTHT